ncbi:MAG: chromosome segregation protein SMC [Lachnospirales bacterium]
MYLKRLELQGFKSFPEKIKLEFNKGITAVVGPNGSGKSNIADAVRWVLGEKSAKSLRGNKMEDVIFNGTANRKPLGFAEVSMVMDNTDKKLNIDYSEVTVTRRVYRSGESDYLINGTKCRAKDILELFMDTGVGKEGYSIIGQGRIDEILSAKSEDRRLLFEEAAGIVKYRTRSIEATNKLNKERENLVRVNDIISELEAQVGPLEIQAEKAKKAIVITDRLKLVRVNIFVRDAKKYEDEIKKLSSDIEKLNTDLENEKAQEIKNNEEVESLKGVLSDTELKIEEVAESISESRSLKEQKDNDIRLIEQEILHFNSDIERIKNEKENSSLLISEKEENIKEIKSHIEVKKSDFENKQKIYNDKLEAFSKLSTKVSDNEELLNQYNQDIISKMNKSTDIKGDISKKQAMVEQLKLRNNQIENDISSLKEQLLEREEALSFSSKELERAENENKLSLEKISQMTNQLNKLNSKIIAEKENQDKINKSIQEKNSRLKILSELEKSYEGYYGGVKAVLSQRDSKNPDFRGISGAVGELINMPKEYEVAIEIALGSAIQNIIASTEKDVTLAINYLKKNNKGRATFLPMTTIKAKTLGSEKYKIINEEGIVGIAKDLISYSEEYENIMSSLLDRVIIADNIKNAINLANKTNHNYKIVTLEGELLNVGGSMTGGSVNKKSAGIFSRGREILTLRDELKALFEEQVIVNRDVDKMIQIGNNLDYKITEAKEELQTIAIRKTEATNKIEQAKEYLSDINLRINNLSNELSEINKTIDLGEKELEEGKNSLEIVNSEIEEINNKLDKYQSQIQTDRDVREESSKEITSLRVEINQLENDIYSYNSDISRIISEIEGINKEIENAKINTENIKNKILAKNEEKENISSEIKNIIEKYESYKLLSEELNNKKAEINEKIDTLNQDIIKQLETKSAIEKELTRLELRKETVDTNCRKLYDSMWDEYEMTYVAAREYETLDISDSELQKEERSLRGQLKALGSVNLNAVEEYTAVKERYDFLTKNRDDIIQTEKKLIKVIDQLEKLMTEQFAEQFKIISDNFSLTFAEMFGGGKAELKLADNSDILNCGIDIIVQPPGKALQNMMLLSGGEKALTAMALLFAILKMKPSPFCILDEIEAALDDANVNRYAEYLDNFTEDTQFIVITHRKGTMEAADILYGVTMQEQGVSKLVSVKFDEAKEAIN